MNTHEPALRHWREAFLFWFVWVSVATHFPQSPLTGEEPFFESPDKLLHFLCFGILGFLFIQTKWVKNTWLCWVIVGLWALFDEMTQHLLPIEREFSYEDLIASELGITSFILWTGALSGESVSHIRDTLKIILSKAKNWTIILFIGSLVTSITTLSIWYLLKEMLGKQYSSGALFIAYIVATGCVFWFIVRRGGLQKEVARLVKVMLPTVLLTMVFVAMAGILVSFTSFEPWVIAMLVLMMGTRVAWARAT